MALQAARINALVTTPRQTPTARQHLIDASRVEMWTEAAPIYDPNVGWATNIIATLPLAPHLASRLIEI